DANLPEEEFTLPSLEEVMKSVHDAQVQRVLEMYRDQHNEVPASTPQLRVIVASTWRSGSTLLGEILEAHPGVFYHYEPLMPYGLQQLGPGMVQDEVTEQLRDILHCDYSKQDDYLKFAFVNHDMFMRNTRLWSMCSAMPRSKCYEAENLGRLCSLFPVHVMKLVRARLSLLTPLLTDPRVKIIWLVRDPRAIMSSRKSSVSWCETQACIDPAYMCSDMMEDYRTFINLNEVNKKQIYLLRYEDFAKRPYDITKEILRFVDLPYHEKIQDYLADHLTSDEDEPWSTRHDPKSRVNRWMKLMQFKDVIKIQYHCQRPMKALGYRLFTSKTDLNSGNSVGLLNLP
ncbi:unnamed protein product, partial [Meganyctiphanes norvegica]